MIREIKATVYFLTPEEGGRRTPVLSGYRGTLYLRPNEPEHGNDGLVNVVGRNKCSPGEQCGVRIRFVCPEYVQDYLELGKRFEMKEGPITIGRGTIVDLIHDD